MQNAYKRWIHAPSLRGRLIWLCVSSVLVTLLVSLLVLVLLISNVMEPFVNREVEFAMQAVSRSLSTKVQLLEDTLLRTCKSHQMATDASEARSETFKSLVDIYSDKNIVVPGLPFVEMAYFIDLTGAFDVVCYHENLSNEQTRLNKDVYDRWADPFGTVIFVLNQAAVESIMSKLSDYQDSFWYLFDKDGSIVLSESTLHLHPEEQFALSETGRNASYTRKIGNSRYLLFSEASGMGLRCAVGVPSVQILRLLYQVAAPYVLSCVLLLLAIAVIVFFAVMHRLRPLQEMTLQLQQVAQQNFSVKLPQYDCQEFSTMSQAFNAMTDAIDHLINDIYEKKLVAMDSELRFLQSQVNPHFMYNVLCSMALMAQLDGNPEIQRMASNFAGLTH